MRRAAGLETRRDDDRCGGFTLVELIVVIVIVGLAATFVVLSVPEPGGSVASEAERFAARAKAARDGAIVAARPVLLAVDAGGYGVLRRTGGEWRSVAQHPWADGTEAELSGDPDGRVRFEPTGIAEPAYVVLRRGSRQVGVRIGQDGTIHVRR